jgi:hypothetical protein
MERITVTQETNRMKTPKPNGRKFWVLVHYHRFGTSPYMVWQNRTPTEAMARRVFPDYEPDREDEGVGRYGPFYAPMEV